MKFVNVSTLVLILFMAFSAMAESPVIISMPTSLDMGTMEQHQIKKDFLILRNGGDAPLTISKIETTCGCTAAELEKNELAPGEATQVNISFDSKKFEGKLVKFIKVFSNDPMNPVLDIALNVTIHVPIVITPAHRSCGFGSITPGEKPVQRINLHSMDVTNLDVTASEYNRDIFEITINEDYGSTDSDVELQFGITDNPPKGTFREIARFSTNVPEQPTFDIELSGTVVDLVVIRPDRVNWRYIHKNEPMRKTFIVEPTVIGHKVTVTSAEIDLKGFKVTKIEPTPSGHGSMVSIEGYPLKISDPIAIEAGGRMIGTLLIKTDKESSPELTAKIMYLLKI
jgi:hypothetical protein